jgi:mono/diheme cytochrome c family protein
MDRFLIGIILGVLLVPAAVLVWLYTGKPPVAVNDPPFPHERQLTGMLLNTRIKREMVETPPIQADEDSLAAGAHIYSEKCAVCHGFHGKPSVFGTRMFPEAPPLWEKHHHGSETALGVSDDPPGETYWKVANGIRLTGMPAYKDLLTDTEIWQVSLLLANADKPLPPAAVKILHGEPAAPASAAPEAKKK